jgi:hypothetical protein
VRACRDTKCLSANKHTDQSTTATPEVWPLINQSNTRNPCVVNTRNSSKRNPSDHAHDAKGGPRPYLNTVGSIPYGYGMRDLIGIRYTGWEEESIIDHHTRDLTQASTMHGSRCIRADAFFLFYNQPSSSRHSSLPLSPPSWETTAPAHLESATFVRNESSDTPSTSRCNFEPNVRVLPLQSW